MFDGDSLSALLYALATGDRERARNVVHTDGGLSDTERARLLPIVDEENETPERRARLLGDALRELVAPRDLSNECYRLAFYLGAGPVELSANPLFAYFSAHRAGPLLDKWIHYFPIYHRHLGPYRGRETRLLEIGVYHGGSLDMWQAYLGSAAQVVGIDIDESAGRRAGSNHVVLIGDQVDANFLEQVVATHGPFDVVIDDGGHGMEQQITSAETLFPLLNDGGAYVVEDCHTSYWEEFGGGLAREGTFISWVKDRVDDLHRFHFDTRVSPTWTEQVGGIHCYDSVVVLDKSARTPPFSEQSGTSDFVFGSRPISVLVGEMLATRDASIDRYEKVDSELRRTREAFESEVRTTQDELAEVRQQVRAMRGSVSWRVTSPLRAVRRSLRRS